MPSCLRQVPRMLCMKHTIQAASCCYVACRHTNMYDLKPSLYCKKLLDVKQISQVCWSPRSCTIICSMDVMQTASSFPWLRACISVV